MSSQQLPQPGPRPQPAARNRRLAAAPDPPALSLFEALDARLLTSPPTPLLARRAAMVALVTPDEPAIGIELRRGRRPRARRTCPPRPTTVVRGSAPVLQAVVEGQRSGVEAFLHGDVTVRGDLSLALALDGLVAAAADRPLRWPRTEQVNARGVATAVVTAGDPQAPPLVVLHGLGATNASVLPLVWELAEDYHVLAPDLPGFGASRAPRASYSIGWYTRWLEDLLTATGIGPAVLIGNSLGGRLAIEAGLVLPERVRGLVLLCPSPAFRRFRRLVPLARMTRPELALLPVRLSHRLVVEAIRAMFSDPQRLPRPWYDAAADEFLRVMRTGPGRVAFFACARQIYLESAFGPRGFWTRLPELATPSLFLWGDRDRLVPSSYARHVAEALPDAGSVVLEDCGHVPQFEHPELTVDLIRGFLEQLAAW